MTFVHSCGNLGLLLSGYVLDSRRDLRGVIEMGELVLPWAILFHMTLDILHQIAEAFPLVISHSSGFSGAAAQAHIGSHPR